MGIAAVISTLAPAPWTWRCPSCALRELFPGLAAGPPQARRAGLTSVVATCYLLGVSTRRMARLVESLGVTSLSKSQVSEMAKDLDEAVEAFRTRPLDGGPYTFVAADALVLKVRENGRVVGVHTLVATGVNAEGYREILGVAVTSAEDARAGWRSSATWWPAGCRGSRW
jgi:putative transposase